MELYAILEELGIVYDEIEHPPVFTVEEAQSLKERIDGVGCKNLLLTDNRREKFFLVVLEDRKKADLKEIAHLCGTSRLTFANAAELNELLHLYPGGVSPLGIIYDRNCLVTLVLDNDLIGKHLLFHPNTTTKTISISYDDFIKFAESQGHSYMYLK